MSKWGWVLVFFAAISCDSDEFGYGQCPPNAACRASCKRGEAALCMEYPGCPEQRQVWVDVCGDGYRGNCQCRDQGEDCAGLDCVAGTYCFEGKCLKRIPCGESEKVCEPGWSCMLSGAGLCVQAIATGQNHPGSMQLAGDALYFANQSAIGDDGKFEGGASVRSVRIDGSDVVNLADSELPVRTLAVDDDFVYYVRGTEDEQALLRVARSGGEPTMLFHGLHLHDALVLSDGRLYWLDKRSDEFSVRLISAAVSGDGDTRVLWTRDHVTRGPLIVDNELYWLEEASEFWRANLDGSDAQLLAASERRDEQLHVMASDGKGFYFGWSDDDHDSGVSVYDASSKSLERIGTDAHNDHGTPVVLALDDENVYVQIHYPRSRPLRTSLFRLDKSAKSSSELTHVHVTNAHVSAASQPVDAESVYITSTNYEPDREEPEILRIRKRW